MYALVIETSKRNQKIIFIIFAALRSHSVVIAWLVSLVNATHVCVVCGDSLWTCDVESCAIMLFPLHCCCCCGHA